MLGTVMAQVVKPLFAFAVPAADINALARAQQTRCLHIFRAGPACGAVKIFRIFGQAFSSLQVEEGEDPDGHNAAEDDCGGPGEKRQAYGGIGHAAVLPEPDDPMERRVERHVSESDQGLAQRGLVSKTVRDQLGGADVAQDQEAHAAKRGPPVVAADVAARIGWPPVELELGHRAICFAWPFG